MIPIELTAASNDVFKAYLNDVCGATGLTYYSLAKQLGLPISSFYNVGRNPRKWVSFPLVYLVSIKTGVPFDLSKYIS